MPRILLCRLDTHGVHPAVFTVVDLRPPVYRKIAGQRVVFLNEMVLALQRPPPVIGGDLAVDIWNGLRQQCFQRLLRVRLTGGRGRTPDTIFISPKAPCRGGRC